MRPVSCRYAQSFRLLVLCSTKIIPIPLAHHRHRALPVPRDIVAFATLGPLPSVQKGSSSRTIFERCQCILGQHSIASAVSASHSSGREIHNASDSATAAGADTPRVFDMDVTRHNFESVLPSILSALKSCDFVALDGEFTGLYPSPDVPFG